MLVDTKKNKKIKSLNSLIINLFLLLISNKEI